MYTRHSDTLVWQLLSYSYVVQCITLCLPLEHPSWRELNQLINFLEVQNLQNRLLIVLGVRMWAPLWPVVTQNTFLLSFIQSTGRTIFETEEVAYDITYHPPTIQHWVPSSNSLTTIHTRARIALATHMTAGWVNNPQVAVMTLRPVHMYQNKHFSLRLPQHRFKNICVQTDPLKKLKML